MAFASIVTPPPSCLEMDTLIKWDPNLFFTPPEYAPINGVPFSHAYALEVSGGDEPAFSPIVAFSDGHWTSSIDAWMAALGYPSFKGYPSFPKEVLVLIYQAAMRGKRMRLFAFRVFLANLLKHPLEFTLPYFPDDELEEELELEE